MPTGYTAAIKDGITFEQFALNCARNFGALIMMRDEPSDAEIPEAFQPSTWNADRLAKARAELLIVESLPEDECRKRALDDFWQAQNQRDRTLIENSALESKYRDMLQDVRSWAPPTPDHQGLRDFMEKQIEESIKFDCGYIPEEPVLKTASQWRSAQIVRLTRDIAYHANADAEEVARTDRRNAWLRQLRDSLAQTTAT